MDKEGTGAILKRESFCLLFFCLCRSRCGLIVPNEADKTGVYLLRAEVCWRVGFEELLGFFEVLDVLM